MKNSPTPVGRSRISSIDIVRGAAMVFMALDHVRDFVTELRFQPEDLARGSAALLRPAGSRTSAHRHSFFWLALASGSRDCAARRRLRRPATCSSVDYGSSSWN